MSSGLMFVINSRVIKCGKIFDEMRCHLEQLRTALMHYFPATECCAYFCNPFPANRSFLPVSAGEQGDIVNIQSDETVRTIHKYSPINF